LTDTDKQNSTGKYTNEIQLNEEIMQNTAEENYPGSVNSYDTRPGNEMGFFYNAPKPIRSNLDCEVYCKSMYSRSHHKE